jgi:hypothetical protein
MIIISKTCSTHFPEPITVIFSFFFLRDAINLSLFPTLHTRIVFRLLIAQEEAEQSAGQSTEASFELPFAESNQVPSATVPRRFYKMISIAVRKAMPSQS